MSKYKVKGKGNILCLFRSGRKYYLGKDLDTRRGKELRLSMKLHPSNPRFSGMGAGILTSPPDDSDAC